ncbi:MAG: hypothetical protein IIZ13_12650 [Renibacterium sp.]|nr:hypothetical protein [Renibacterium sp.]
MRAHALVADQVWDISGQRQKIVELSATATTEVSGRPLGVICEPLMRTGADGVLRQSVRLQWLDLGREHNYAEQHDDAPGDLEPQELPLAKLLVSGQPVPLLWAGAPEGAWRVLVPAVEASTAAEIGFELDGAEVSIRFVLEPQRRWSVHLIHHSHYDIGYTDPQHVVRANHLEYLDSALAQMRATDHLPDAAKFRWNEEALFAVEDWLANRTPEQARELIRRVREGRLSLSAMPFNLHTEACSTDELHELLRPAAKLRGEYGIDLASAMQTDVPGHVVGFPDALGSTGVKYLSVAHNWAGRSHPNGFGELDVPRLFRWHGPAGNSVLVWRTDSPHGGSYMEGNTVGFSENFAAASDIFPCYLANLANQPFPLVAETVFGWMPEAAEADKAPYPLDVLHLRLQGRWADNAPPNGRISQLVAAWNEAWDYPKLRLSTNEAFFEEAVARHGDQIADLEGDWNDWWGHGIGAAASEMALSRQAQVQLAQAHTLAGFGQLLGASPAETSRVDTDRGYRQIALWDEHTWGAADSWLHQDHGPSAGERQWHWKAARAYEALDESQSAMQQAREILAAQLDSADPGQLTVFNTANQRRDGIVEFFLSDSVLPVQTPLAVRDQRDGRLLPVECREERENFRPLGRQVRVALADVPALGRLGLRLETAEPAPAAADQPETSAGEDLYLLENESFRVQIDPRSGSIASILDKSAGRELVNQDAVFGFNGYIYDTYSTAGPQNHNSSKHFEVPGKLTLLAGRSISTAAALLDSSSTALGRSVTVRSFAPGANWVESTYTLPSRGARLEIRNRVSKEATFTKESAFFAFPFAVENATVRLESAGGLAGPGAAAIPGSAEYMHGIRHWASIEGNGQAIGWASADAPLVEVATISLPYIPFPNSLPVSEPGTVYSWIHNNIWDTNFPVQQAFEMDFRYCISSAQEPGAVAALQAAADFADPLFAVPGKATSPSAELLTIDRPDVQLVDLLPGTGSLLVRLLWTDPAGGECEIGLPGLVSAFRSNYLGERLDELQVLAGRVRVHSPGAGVLAVELRTE